MRYSLTNGPGGPGAFADCVSDGSDWQASYLAVITPAPQATGDDDTASFCASEGQFCPCNGHARYETSNPTMQSDWVEVEKAVLCVRSAFGDVDAPTACVPTCTDSVTVHIEITTWGNEISWNIDGGTTTSYSNSDNNSPHFHSVDLSASGEHTFTFSDSWGDGWHGGYWAIINACDETIAGGPEAGQVSGSGGTFVFDGSQQCCGCGAEDSSKQGFELH